MDIFMYPITCDTGAVEICNRKLPPEVVRQLWLFRRPHA